jgi:hypothetical protein
LGDSRIEDGELELAEHEKNSPTPMVESNHPAAVDIARFNLENIENQQHLNLFVQRYISDVIGIMVIGSETWSTENRKRYLRGLEKLIEYAEAKISDFLPALCTCLGQQLREEDSEVRRSAESCCVRLGSQLDPSEALEIVLPRVNGAIAGGDTSSQRTCAVRLLTHLLMGFDFSKCGSSGKSSVEISNNPEDTAALTEKCLLSVANSLATTALYEFREAYLREAALLLNRGLIDRYPRQIAAESSAAESSAKGRFFMQQYLALSLLYLSGRCYGEEDIVPEIAKKELAKLAILVQQNSDVAASGASDGLSISAVVSLFLNIHFDFLLMRIMGEGVTATALEWTAATPAKTAFEVLIRECPSGAWARHAAIIRIFGHLVSCGWWSVPVVMSCMAFLVFCFWHQTDLSHCRACMFRRNHRSNRKRAVRKRA